MDTETFGHPMAYLTLTSKSNSQILLYTHSITIFLVLCIAIADYYLIYRNEKIKFIL